MEVKQLYTVNYKNTETTNLSAEDVAKIMVQATVMDYMNEIKVYKQ
jgi:hypothetical protein